MRSPRGAAAATAIIGALPLALAVQSVFGGGAEPAIHFALAAGAGLTALAVPDFRAARWAARLGSGSTGLLAAVFGVQGVSQVAPNDVLHRVAFQILGQGVEALLMGGFLAWCLAALLAEERSAGRVVGLIVTSAAAAVLLYSVGLLTFGAPGAGMEGALKLFYLAPFAWLGFASTRPAVAPAPTPSSSIRP